MVERRELAYQHRGELADDAATPIKPRRLGLITLDEIVAIAKEVVQEKGEDYVYINPEGETAKPPSAIHKSVVCKNWDIKRDQPSCIAGHILFRAGVDKSIIIKKNELSALDFSDKLVGDAALFLGDIQAAQDRGVPWGIALWHALNKRGLK